MVVAVMVAIAASGFAVACYGRDRHGDPDPGHRRLAALKPVLSAVPTTATAVRKHAYAPSWDSCDGKQHGWDDPTVDAQFVTTSPVGPIAAQVIKALRQQGWSADTASQPGAWYLEKRIGHDIAAVQLLGPGDGNDEWDLQAYVPPAVHPLTC